MKININFNLLRLWIDNRLSEYVGLSNRKYWYLRKSWKWKD